MKKVIIPVISALFIVSIVMVAFLGTIPTSDEDTIYCDYIISNMQSKYQPTGDRIYEVTQNDNHPEYGTKEYEDWSKTNFSYTVKIFDYKYLYDYLGRTLSLDCVAKTLKKDKKITNPKLNYHYDEPLEEARATINAEGVVTFTEYTTRTPGPGSSVQSYTFVVVSDDAHNAQIRIEVVAKPYN